LFLEGGDLGVGEGGFARSLVAAQEDELLHGVSLLVFSFYRKY